MCIYIYIERERDLWIYLYIYYIISRTERRVLGFSWICLEHLGRSILGLEFVEISEFLRKYFEIMSNCWICWVSGRPAAAVSTSSVTHPYVYICMHVYAYIYIYIYTHTCIYTYNNIWHVKSCEGKYVHITMVLDLHVSMRASGILRFLCLPIRSTIGSHNDNSRIFKLRVSDPISRYIESCVRP